MSRWFNVMLVMVASIAICSCARSGLHPTVPDLNRGSQYFPPARIIFPRRGGRLNTRYV